MATLMRLERLHAVGEPGRAAGSARYAIYFAPAPQSAWWRFGAQWLGRDAVSGLAVQHLCLPGLDGGQVSRVTAAPRQYGFHATLKAPFRLADGYSRYDVFRQMAVLAAGQEPFALPRLELAVIDDFVALVPGAPSAPLTALAAQCVSALDNLRAPPARAEHDKRRGRGLTPRQEQLLAEWGYPYVFDEYRFHLTLTGRLEREDQARVMAALAPRVSELNREPTIVDALVLFIQPAESVPFHVARRYSFSGGMEAYRDG